jgi:hypothetical protein
LSEAKGEWSEDTSPFDVFAGSDSDAALKASSETVE